MLKKLKWLLVLSILGFGLGYAVFVNKDRFVVLTNPPKLESGTAANYLLAVYARYQLQPSTGQLLYSLKLLSKSQELSKTQQAAVARMLAYVEQQPEYSEARLLQAVAQLKLRQIHAKKVAIFGMDLSSVVTEKHDEQLQLNQLIQNLQWAVHLHAPELYQQTLTKIADSALLAEPKLLDNLRSLRIKPPELPWMQWLQELQEHA